MRGISLLLFGALRVERRWQIDTHHAFYVASRKFRRRCGSKIKRLRTPALEISRPGRPAGRSPRARTKPFLMHLRHGFSGCLECRSGTIAALLRSCGNSGQEAGSLLCLLHDQQHRPPTLLSAAVCCRLSTKAQAICALQGCLDALP